MKILLLICFQFVLFHSFAQGTFESCFSRYFSSSLRSSISDSLGDFFVTGSCDLPLYYSKPGIFLKLNAQGDILEEKYFGGELDLYDIQNTADGNMFVSGTFDGCDIGGCGAIIIKVNSQGDTLWTSSFAVSQFCNSDRHFMQSLSLQNGNYLYKAISTIYFLNSSGDSITSVVNPRIISINESFAGEIICGTDSGIIKLDSIGQQTDSLVLGFSVGKIFHLADSTYLIPYMNYLYKYDLNFTLLSQLDLTSYATSVSELKIFKDQIWCYDRSMKKFISFTDQFQFVDSFTVNSINASVNDFSVNDSNILLVGNESLSSYSNCYLKSLTVSGSADTYNNDIAITELIVDTTIVDQPSPLPSGVYELRSVCKIKVQNIGADTLRNFYFNTETYLSGYCGNGKIQMYFDSLSISPGQSDYIQLDTLREWGIVISQFPFELELCGWISCPNNKPDLNHADNELCDTAIFYGMVGVNEISKSNKVVVYPNPFEDKLNIELKTADFNHDSFRDAMLQISDLTGKIIFTKANLKNNEQIDASQFSPGVYILSVFLDDDRVIQRMVKYY